MTKTWTKQTRLAGLLALTLTPTLALSLACSDDEEPNTLDVALENAGGLATGDKVLVAGLEVGTIKALRVADGKALITVAVSEGNSVPTHEDSCAHVASRGEHKALVVVPGDTGVLAGPIPQCQAALTDQIMGAADSVLGAAEQVRERATKAIAEGSERTARELGRQVTMQAAEFSEGLVDGQEDIRRTGRNLTKAGRALEQGVNEGLAE